jgi:hypothetical protein
MNGFILIEPAGPPDSTDFPDFNGLHMFGVYGDYISSRNQTSRKLAVETVSALFQKNGGISDVVSLPDDSLVKGNSHLLMQDRNSHYVFKIVENWLRQFSTSTMGTANSFPNTQVKVYPNPAGNNIRIDGIPNEAVEYGIYSMDGRLLKAAKTFNSTIDLSDLPDGLLIVTFKYKEQVFVNKIVKNSL